MTSVPGRGHSGVGGQPRTPPWPASHPIRLTGLIRKTAVTVSAHLPRIFPGDEGRCVFLRARCYPVAGRGQLLSGYSLGHRLRGHTAIANSQKVLSWPASRTAIPVRPIPKKCWSWPASAGDAELSRWPRGTPSRAATTTSRAWLRPAPVSAGAPGGFGDVASASQPCSASACSAWACRHRTACPRTCPRTFRPTRRRREPSSSALADPSRTRAQITGEPRYIEGCPRGSAKGRGHPSPTARLSENAGRC